MPEVLVNLRGSSSAAPGGSLGTFLDLSRDHGAGRGQLYCRKRGDWADKNVSEQVHGRSTSGAGGAASPNSLPALCFPTSPLLGGLGECGDRFCQGH